MRSATPVRRLSLPLLIAALVCALGITLGAGRGAAATPGQAKKHSHGPLIVSPRQGLSVKGDSVRIVVQAGPEHEDLKARLNGVAIGRRFLVAGSESRRVLEATPVDGLRRGKNVLKVWVLKRGGYRRAAVHFEIAHHRPLGSAGVDRRVVAGSRVELQGLLRLDKSDAGRKGVRWDVVKAPARSALSRPPGSSARASAEANALGERHSLTPTFRPDVRGRYKVRLTAATGNGTSVDTTTVYAVPPNPLIVLKTAVPATAAEPRPGIQVGGEILHAPYMRSEANGKGSYTGSVEKLHYVATFQVITYDRVTMALKWNRTYGVCTVPGDYYPCMSGPKGTPVFANLAQELAALGPETLVIVSSHPSGSTPALQWGTPSELGLEGELAGIGMPDESTPEIGAQVGAAKAGEMAGVGVPGLASGDAKFIVGGGQTGMDGYLTPDSNAPKHYFFVPAQRVPFDTRSATSCNAAGCTVAQTVGATVDNGTVGAGQAGFLVSAYDRHTLALLGHETFVTATGQNEGSGGLGAAAASQMAAYIKAISVEERLVAITSIHGPAQSQPVLYTPGVTFQTWEELDQAITLVGGSREAFNRGATTPGSDYSLVGSQPGPEGAGSEASAPSARLRGALVPNPRSEFEAQGVTTGETPPAEKLMQILVRAPQATAWPLEGNAEAKAAIAAIGSQCSELGPNPRAAYWTQLTSPEVATTALAEVQKSTRPANATFSAAAFAAAKKELETEIEYVRKTRVYMKELAQPANSAGKIGWQEAGLISAELEERLKDLQEEGAAKAEYLSIVEEVLEAVSLGFELGKFEKTAKFLTAAAILAEGGQTAWEGTYSGGSKPPGVTVQALQLGKQLRVQAEATEAAFARMGDVIVSDWTKLSEVGKYGGCDFNGGCGPNGEFEELSHNKEAEETASAAMKRSFDRELYERLVPLAFPIWNTGNATIPETGAPPEEFYCSDLSYPFNGAPALAYHRTFWLFDPATQTKIWRVYISIARSERTYGWAPETMLKRMFEPVPANNSNAEAGGLGIDVDKFMRQGLGIKEYKSGWECSWHGAEAV